MLREWLEITKRMKLVIPCAAASLDGLMQLLLGFGDVCSPICRKILAKRFDIPGLVLSRKPLKLVENAV